MERKKRREDGADAYLLKPRVDVWSAAGRCRCLSFDRLLRRQEITSPLINDSPRHSLKAPRYMIQAWGWHESRAIRGASVGPRARIV